MTPNHFLFAINIIGAFASLAFIGYEINVLRKRHAEGRRSFSPQPLWQRHDAPPSGV
jgi:hypothetical protein